MSAHATLAARERGIALVLVLWLVVLLGIVATSHVKNVRTETLLVAKYVETAQARALAQAGAELAILQLATPALAGKWPVNGTVGRFALAGHEISVAVRDTTGLVDLNAASADLLGTLISAAGVDDARRDRLVDAILDWRDPDDLKRLNGAEDDDYLTAGLPWTARDGGFASVEELGFVLGMTPALFTQLAPFVTVHSERPAVNLEYAPPFVLGALTGEVVAAPGETRAAAGGVRNGTYQVYVSASASSGTVASLEAIVNIAASDEHPYAILDWLEPMRTPFPQAEEDRI